MTKTNWSRWMVLGMGCALCQAGSAGEGPPFEEVYRLVRSNLVSLGETDLNRAAVEGLLKQLHPRVLMATDEVSSTLVGPAGSRLEGQRLFDRTLAYFRVRRVEAGLANDFTNALASLANRGELQGLVLDLRFAQGVDYAEAGRLADGFVATPTPLLRWGDETFTATAKTNAFDRPVAVLVNSETKGAAEALAAALRHAQVGLLLGSATAGQASLFKEFPLTNGQRLRIAATPIGLGNGEEIPRTGIQPDIEVAVKPEDDLLFLEDPYRVPPRWAQAQRRSTAGSLGGATNRPARINEAELVRLKREGQSLDDEAPPPVRPAAVDAPVVVDPALARALDLLKGLAVLKARR